MNILVANLGSTSFKFRLYQMAEERLLARGGVERIGSAKARFYLTLSQGAWEWETPVPDHAVALERCLEFLADPERKVLGSVQDLAAIGFKAVHARALSGVQRVDDRVLAAMEEYNSVAPAHNPPYVRAMRLLAERFPHLPLVAAFETDFHKTIPPQQRLYAVPREWAEKHGIIRHGFHGASHRYVAERTAQLLGRSDLRIISCHLGGSSSLCAIRDGRSVANSLGFSPQTGLPHNNRVGDFDPFALPVLLRETGKTLEQVLEELATRSGLLGLSGCSNDLRDIQAAADQGDLAAQEALGVYVASIRHYLGAYLVLLGGADVVVFTGGIGENSARLRAEVCKDLQWLGLHLDPDLNASARGECAIHHATSRIQVWTMPTNEELIVARQVKAFLEGR
jgi:acetate kinase